MLTLAGYQISQLIHCGNKTTVYRGYREQDGCPLIFKTLSLEHPAPKDLACLQHEFDLTHDWQENGAPRSYALLRHEYRLVLVLPDIGGQSLNRILADQPPGQAMPLDRFLRLAIALAQALSRIHQRHLIHKDINPSNLVLNPHSGQVQIIDFGIATQLTRETTQVQNPGHLEGTLAYLSPEQTGRMNRAVDYRSDFYSLGVSLYEILCGVRPFTANDPMELVHCHLAKMPVSAHELRPDVPLAVSQLIAKLMAKTAEARYQSGFGLIADLERCLQAWNQYGEIANFTLGQHDVSERFQIPQKLYGRQQEVRQLLDAFERIHHGPSEMLLVAGYSGVGKSALVHEVHKPITESHGYFISGKFDQFQRDIPYASLIQAFQELLRQILTESPERIARWKARLQQALGANAQVIIKVIAEVEWIIGPQSATPELPPAQALNRFNLVFQQFIRTFASAAHPLVLFLDDLQWADQPSLQLIKVLMSAAETRHLLLIGAYRDNEVSPAHPLMLSLEEIRQASGKQDRPPPTTLTLAPLEPGHVQQLLQETLHGNAAQSALLAQLCMEKTAGNPFFLSQFLRALVDAGQIAFEHSLGCWLWDIRQLQQSSLSHNVIDLMAAKIQTLPVATQTLLQLAACIGNQFDLATLALAAEQGRADVARTLWPALQENLVLPVDEAYKYMGTEAAPDANAGFKFIHDRVQQAACSLMAPATQAVCHLRIARLLLAHSDAQQQEQRIFDLVYHGNCGQALIVDASEREQLAQLNLRAGRKARASSAYGSALAYFQNGLQQLASGWQGQYALTLALHVEACEAAYLSGEFDQMEALAAQVQQHAATLLDRVKVVQILVRAQVLQNRSLQAIRIALPVLKQLGVTLPEQPSHYHFLRGLRETRAALASQAATDLDKLAPMTDPVALAAMQMLSSIAPAAYFALPRLLPLLSCKQVELSIQYGNTALSGYAYAVYGLILCGIQGEIDAGNRFASLAIATMEHFSADALRAKIEHIVESFIRHWCAPFHERLQPLLNAYQSGVQTGDFEYATYAAGNYCNFLFFTGRPLRDLQTEIKKFSASMIQFKQEQALNWQKIFAQAILNLQGFSHDPCRLTGSSYDEERMAITVNNRTAMFRISFYKMMLLYLFQRYQEALEQAVIAEQHLDAVLGFSGVPVCHFYMALIRLALAAQSPAAERRPLLQKVAAIQKKLHIWANHAPMNHLHKWHLVEAESARVANRPLQAMQHYDQAIKLAQHHAFPHEEALANELAGYFYLARGQEKVARTYLQDSYYGYQQWGAHAKLRQMEQQYPDWLTRLDSRAQPEPTMRTLTADDNTSGGLDLAAVLKASQALSGEIVLAQLLEKLMRIGIENAGAGQGVLLLEQAGEWKIEAQGTVSQSEVKLLPTLPKADAPPHAEPPPPVLPNALIQYVAMSKKALVLDDACSVGHFVHDPYIQQHQVKSVLCLPILRQGKLTAILYLENNLTTGAFSPDRLALLKILASQAAISIENARVYETLESTVAQRTAALSLAYTEADQARQQAQLAGEQATQALHELRATQSQLIQSEKLASLGQLVAGVAHELNTPIGNALITASSLSDSSRNFAQALEKGEMRKSALLHFVDTTQSMCQVIERSCERAARLITSFKQVAADQTSEHRRSFDLRALVADNIAALRAGFSPDPWQIEIDIAPGIVCDSYPGPLGQVIANLVQNAIYHGFANRDHGHLRISASVKDGDQIEMAFADDGKGMEPKVLAHIFEPFYTTQMGQGGPGLGLSISQNIVASVLGGTLEASSQPGAGATFALHFPRCAAGKGAQMSKR